MVVYDMVLLESRKETENKLRWDAQLTDAVFPFTFQDYYE
jgi:hypothetical protein